MRYLTGLLSTVLILTGVVMLSGWRIPEILPAPPATGSIVLVIYESAPNDPEYNAAVKEILTQDQYWEGYKDRGLRRRFYDKDAAEIGPKLREKIKLIPVPVLAVLTDSGDTVYAGECPLTTDEIDAIVTRYTGK